MLFALIKYESLYAGSSGLSVSPSRRGVFIAESCGTVLPFPSLVFPSSYAASIAFLQVSIDLASLFGIMIDTEYLSA